MDDFLLFKNYFEKFLPVEDDELIEIASVFEPLEVQSAEVFLPEGTVDRYIIYCEKVSCAFFIPPRIKTSV